MLKTGLILNFVLFFCCSNFSFGQSKKVLNNELRSDLLSQKTTYDSISALLTEKQRNLKMARHKQFDDLQYRIDFENKEKEVSQIFVRNHKLLKKLGVNADSIYNLSLMPVFSDGGFTYIERKDPYQKDIILLRIDTLNNWTQMRLKEQNLVLRKKINEYDSVNKQNLLIFEKVQLYIDSIAKVDRENDAYFKAYKQFIEDLADKSNVLAKYCTDIINQRKEQVWAEDRKEYDEELKKAKRKKNGDLPFVLPILYREDFPELDALGKPVYLTSKNLLVIKQPAAIPPPPSPVIYDVVDESPDFPGGIQALKEYIVANIVVPQKVLNGEVYGKVFLRFNISETGKISNVKVQRGIPDCKECDEEAKRVVENMPDWTPGKSRGKAVSSIFTLPVTFRSPSLKTD